jgi:hypothetical protein
MREGDKGAKSFYYILFTHLGFIWEKWLHELLGGKSHVVLDFPCKYINPSFGLFGGCSSFGSSFIHSSSSFLCFLGKENELLEVSNHGWLAVVITGVFQP